MNKYDDTLLPFLALMRSELHANAGKGDRPGWLAMNPGECLLEIFYHMGKLQKAVKHNDDTGIREYAADVANMAMMLVDICGLLPDVGDTSSLHSVLIFMQKRRDLFADAVENAVIPNPGDANRLDELDVQIAALKEVLA